MQKLTFFFSGLFDDLESFNGVHSRIHVEQVGDEGEVKFLVAVNDVVSTNKGSRVKHLRVIQHHLRSLGQILNLLEVLIEIQKS